MQKRDNLDAINQDAFNLNLSHILTYPAVQEHFFPLNDCPECQFSRHDLPLDQLELFPLFKCSLFIHSSLSTNDIANVAFT